MSKFDDLSKQIFKDNKFLMQTSQDFYDTVEDEISIDDDGAEVITRTKEELIEEFKKEIEGRGFVEIDGQVIIHKIVLSKLLNKTKYNKLKEFVATDPRMFLMNDFLIERFEKLFDSIFEEVVFDGKEMDMVMLDLRDMLRISVVYITIFEARMKELKKK